MSTTSNIAGVTYLGCKSHFDFGNYNRGVILEMTPTSVEQCALQCAGRSFNRLSISDQACACYMDVNLVIVDQNIIECNKYCGDGPCGTADFINRFSVYDITLMRDTVQASITASISASIAAERSRTEGLRSSTLSSVTGTITSVAITTIAPISTEAATTAAAAIPTATHDPQP
ncbi:hypothetical protein BC829DRAFT_440826 [Chytridium lagenaria]|nr:hypothetical protein BC829DRAFT_440826 [Chytridium lagenaria]